MPSFEAELIRQIGGRGHVRFGHSYSFAAGYVCILLAALADICLVQLSYVERPGNAVVANPRADRCLGTQPDRPHPRHQLAGLDRKT